MTASPRPAGGAPEPSTERPRRRRGLHRGPPAPTTIVHERVEPVEVSVITEVKRRVQRGEVREALLYAYPRVVADIERALDGPFAAGASHRAILDQLRRDGRLGHVPEFLERLYAAYEPVRYGNGPTPLDGAALLGLVTSLYGRRELWALYIEPRPGPPARSPATGPTPPAEGTA